MATSRILVVGDALVELIKTLVPDGTDAEVRRTYFARRFDAAKTIGRKIYVVARSDVMGDRVEGGTRSADPLDYMFSVVIAERMPAERRTWDEKDEWVDELVDFTTTIRNRLQNMRYEPLVDGSTLYPIDTGEREVADIEYLTNEGVFVSEFTNTIREVG